jgi:hypothetical protein
VPIELLYQFQISFNAAGKSQTTTTTAIDEDDEWE